MAITELSDLQNAEMLLHLDFGDASCVETSGNVVTKVINLLNTAQFTTDIRNSPEWGTSVRTVNGKTALDLDVIDNGQPPNDLAECVIDIPNRDGGTAGRSGVGVYSLTVVQDQGRSGGGQAEGYGESCFWSVSNGSSTFHTEYGGAENDFWRIIAGNTSVRSHYGVVTHILLQHDPGDASISLFINGYKDVGATVLSGSLIPTIHRLGCYSSAETRGVFGAICEVGYWNPDTFSFTSTELQDIIDHQRDKWNVGQLATASVSSSTKRKIINPVISR